MIRAIFGLGLAGTLLCMQVGCMLHPPPRLDGVYSLSDNDRTDSVKDELRLSRSGRFSYTEHQVRGDVGVVCTAEGTYTFEANWITLSDGADGGKRGSCLSAERIYVVFEKGEPLLFPDWRLAIASQKDIVPDAWRRTGAPSAYTRQKKEWMPEPYLRYLNGSRLNGVVTSTGKQVTERVPELMVRYWTHMPVTTDLGSERGAFEGMWVCGPDKRPRLIYEVSARSSKIEWEGSVTTGTPLSGPCSFD